MEKKIARFFIIFLVVLLQISFFPNFFSGIMTPGVVISFSIAWVIICGFSEIYLWIVVLGMFLDVFSFWRFGFSPIILIFIAYSVSFFSKRFLIDHRAWGVLVLGIFIICGTAIYFLITPAIFSLNEGKFSELENIFYFPIKSFFEEIAINMIILTLIYFPLKKIENFLSYYDKRVKIKA